LEEIIHLATDVGDLISHIATAATEQSAATAQVNSSISRISSLTQNSSVAAQETAKACTDLSQLALELDNLIQGFKHNEMTNQSSRGVPSLPLKRPPSRIDQFTGNKASRAAAGVLT
jgi:ABC-type transporter Mla subunit MlaD